jgi:hypothetical protein
MQHLRPSGERSFEDLTAKLLSKLAGERIRLCKSGTQGGVDAIAEIPFAIENKRHKKPPGDRALLGGLTYAAHSYPDLQLWVLMVTCKLAPQTRVVLSEEGDERGVEILIFDASASEPHLPGIDSLAALAATDIEITLAAIGDPSWREDSWKPDLNAIEAELREIRRMHAFPIWESNLRTQLRDLPTWRRLVLSQNQRLLSCVRVSAGNAFGTQYRPDLAIRRSMEADLTRWAASCTTADACDVAVVTGSRYDGKTWLVYRWLSENLSELTLPVFFFSSQAVQDAHGDLEALILSEIQETLGLSARHAGSIVRRQRLRRGGSWCLVVLDGANEYTKNPRALASAVLWALPSEIHPLCRPAQPIDESVIKKRGCAVLMTCRTRDFDDDSSWLGRWPVRRLVLGPYDDSEFANALERYNLRPADVANLEESAAEKIRHPHYLDLMVRHIEDLGRFAAVTVDVLNYLDASDKLRPRAGLNGDAFKAVLVGLAERWRHHPRLNYPAIVKQVREVTANVEASVAALISEGVLRQQHDQSWVPDPETLALGMGLFIRERLLSVDDAALENELADLLDPHPDTDEKVRWLCAAVTTSLMADDAHRSSGMFDSLLRAWLSARNLSPRDLQDLKSLSPLLVESILRLLSDEKIASGVLVIAEAMLEAEMTRHQLSIADAIRKWFRLVPIDDPWHRDDEREHVENVVRAASDASLLDLQLRMTLPEAGPSVRHRHRFGLSILCQYPSLAEPLDLLALVVAHGLGDWSLSDGESYALRMLLANVDRSWFEDELRPAATSSDTLRIKFLHSLIRTSSRSDLCKLLPQQSETCVWREELTRKHLRSLDGAQDDKQTLQTAKLAASQALDPGCPPPPRAWRVKLAQAAIARFANPAKIRSGRSQTRDDLDLEALEPALAAWAPDTGARILRSFLADLPQRIQAGDDSWSWAIEDNAALLTPGDRRKLLKLVHACKVTDDRLRHALRRAYLCVIAGAPPSQRLGLLLNHPFHEFEWTEFYDVLASGADERLRQETEAIIRINTNRRRLKRARHLLAALGGWKPSPAELARLIADTNNAEEDSRHAAHTLLVRSRIATTTPGTTLGPLVRVAHSLADEAWQYEAFLDTKRRPGMRGADWIARARSAPLTARQQGAEGTDDDAVVRQGIDRSAVRVAECLGHNARYPSEQFPDGIAAEIGESAFNRWVQSAVAWHAKPFAVHAGVLIPILRRALRTRHSAAKELWTLGYPFDRGRLGRHERIVVQGLNWTLVDIHDPALDDELACELLEELVRDCRSNSECVSVAMGARINSLSRLSRVVETLLHDDDEAQRARARFIVGWMPEDAALRRKIAKRDCSEWVNHIGEKAIARLDRERWAREWLQRFLRETNRARRWAAGRLFLSCSDAATPFWAYQIINNSPATSRRAEAALIVREVRKKVDDHDLQDKFLGYSVRELADVVTPWHRPTRWDDIEITRQEEPA